MKTVSFMFKLSRLGYLPLALFLVVFLPASGHFDALMPFPVHGSASALESKTYRPMSQETLTAILEETREKFSKVKTLKTKLTQEKNISLFSTPIVSEGIFLFKHPDKIRFEFYTPFQSALIVNRKKILKYEMVKGQWQALLQGDQRIAGIILDHMGAWVNGRFNHNGLYKISGKYIPGSNQERPGAVTLILEPKAEEFKQFIHAFELGINGDLNRLDFILIRETEQDFTRIAFYDDRINIHLDDLVFTGNAQGPSPVTPW